MKKIISIALISCGLVFSAGLKAQQTTTTTTSTQDSTQFYYYPSSNVYLNPATNQYWYYDTGSSTWVSAQQLPSTITLVKEPVYTVYYNGTDVWKDNAEHMKKYKVNKNGKVKVKPKGKR